MAIDIIPEKGGQCSFYCRFPLKSRFLKDLDTKKQVVFDTTEILLEDNGMNEGLMKYHKKITPTQNIYYGMRLLFPEAIFLAAAVPEMYLFSCGKYGKKGKQREPKLPGYLYGDYLRDKANLDVFCAGVWQALGEVIGDDQLEKVLNWSKRIDGTYVDYVTQYIDKCNIELLKTPFEKRKDKLRGIAKRILVKPTGYQTMEADLKYWAKEYKTSIYELEDSGLVYPEEIEW